MIELTEAGSNNSNNSEADDDDDDRQHHLSSQRRGRRGRRRGGRGQRGQRQQQQRYERLMGHHDEDPVEVFEDEHDEDDCEEDDVVASSPAVLSAANEGDRTRNNSREEESPTQQQQQQQQGNEVTSTLNRRRQGRRRRPFGPEERFFFNFVVVAFLLALSFTWTKDHTWAWSDFVNNDDDDNNNNNNNDNDVYHYYTRSPTPSPAPTQTAKYIEVCPPPTLNTLHPRFVEINVMGQHVLDKWQRNSAQVIMSGDGSIYVFAEIDHSRHCPKNDCAPGFIHTYGYRCNDHHHDDNDDDQQQEQECQQHYFKLGSTALEGDNKDSKFWFGRHIQLDRTGRVMMVQSMELVHIFVRRSDYGPEQPHDYWRLGLTISAPSRRWEHRFTLSEDGEWFGILQHQFGHTAEEAEEGGQGDIQFLLYDLSKLHQREALMLSMRMQKNSNNNSNNSTDDDHHHEAWMMKEQDVLVAQFAINFQDSSGGCRRFPNCLLTSSPRKSNEQQRQVEIMIYGLDTGVLVWQWTSATSSEEEEEEEDDDDDGTGTILTGNHTNQSSVLLPWMNVSTITDVAPILDLTSSSLTSWSSSGQCAYDFVSIAAQRSILYCIRDLFSSLDTAGQCFLDTLVPISKTMKNNDTDNSTTMMLDNDNNSVYSKLEWKQEYSTVHDVANVQLSANARVAILDGNDNHPPTILFRDNNNNDDDDPTDKQQQQQQQQYVSWKEISSHGLPDSMTRLGSSHYNGPYGLSSDGKLLLVSVRRQYNAKLERLILYRLPLVGA